MCIAVIYFLTYKVEINGDLFHLKGLINVFLLHMSFDCQLLQRNAEFEELQISHVNSERVILSIIPPLFLHYLKTQKMYINPSSRLAFGLRLRLRLG